MGLDPVAPEHDVAVGILRGVMVLQLGLLIWVVSELINDPNRGDLVPALPAFATLSIISATLGWRQTAVITGACAFGLTVALAIALPAWVAVTCIGLSAIAGSLGFLWWKRQRRHDHEQTLRHLGGMSGLGRAA